jgi:hypothetical protein
LIGSRECSDEQFQGTTQNLGFKINDKHNSALNLANWVIEFMENRNAAGEYDEPYEGENWFEEDLRRFAYKVRQEEEMKLWNI